MFGPEQTARWMLSLTFCILISFVILEPLKILLISLLNSIRRVKRDPCESDNIVEFPRVEKSASSISCQSKSCKVSPPQGFALEKARENALKLHRWNNLKKNGLIFTVIFATVVIAICDEHLNDGNIFNNAVISRARFSQNSSKSAPSVMKSTEDFYSWLETQENFQSIVGSLIDGIPGFFGYFEHCE